MSKTHQTRLPEVILLNRQRRVEVECAALLDFARRALVLCAPESADGRFGLRALEEVVVTLVSDRRIAEIHRRFMDVPGATDVITFEHGEIVLSAQTAERCGAEFGHGTGAEAALYIVHGMLHLNGFLDGTESERAAMHAVQDRIWKACLPGLQPARVRH
jgi:probable rRNA maturation factor